MAFTRRTRWQRTKADSRSLLGIGEKFAVAALAAGLRFWSLWSINPRPRGWELVGQLGGYALAAAVLWTLMRFVWIWLRARIREDRDEISSLHQENSVLHVELAALKDTEPKLEALLH